MAERPMRPWIRWVVVRVMAFAIRRGSGSLVDLRGVLDRSFPRRCPRETGEIWNEAAERAQLARHGQGKR